MKTKSLIAFCKSEAADLWLTCSVTGPKGMASSWGGLAWSWQSSESIWTMCLDTWSYSWGILHRARSRTEWSWKVSSNSECSLILWHSFDLVIKIRFADHSIFQIKHSVWSKLHFLQCTSTLVMVTELCFMLNYYSIIHGIACLYSLTTFT